MKVFVTGAAGRLGVRVCSELVSAGHEVTGLDKAGFRFGGITARRLDLLDAARTTAALTGAEAVVHLANHTQPRRTSVDPNFAENIAMNFHVFEAARIARARIVLFASSVQAMTGERSFHDPGARGALPWLPLDGALPATPSNPYALSKAVGEEMLRYLVRNADIAAAALRFPLLLREPPSRDRPSFRNPRLDEAFTWLTFADAARLIRLRLAAPFDGFRIYFPAAARPWLPEEVETLRRKYFPGVPVKTGIPLGSFVDNSAITRETGWIPQDQ